MSDPTTDSFRQMLLEAQLERASKSDVHLEAISDKLSTTDERWSEESLTASIASVLADSIREAGQEDSEVLSRSIAPHVVSTVKREISNAHPEIIDALSPRMGTLINASVAHAVADLQRQIDAAMPFDMWIATLKSRLTGAPSSGWLVDNTKDFRVLEAYLIERGSGVLLARDKPPEVDDDDESLLDDDLIAGMIAALDSFASDAFGSGGLEELRQLKMSHGTVYLRASATKILALRCSGEAPDGIEQRVDALLERAIAQATGQGGDGGDIDPRRLIEGARESSEKGINPSAIIGKAALSIIAVVAVVAGHFYLENANRTRWVDALQTAARDDPGLTGYPINADYVADAGQVRLRGLAPDKGAIAEISARVARVPSPLKAELLIPVAGERLK